MPLQFRERGVSGAQLDVLCGDLIIGTVYKAPPSVRAGRDPYWSWMFHITAGPPGFAHSGNAPSLDQVKKTVEKLWDEWLNVAGLHARS